jgi:hypothetical protein
MKKQSLAAPLLAVPIIAMAAWLSAGPLHGASTPAASGPAAAAAPGDVFDARSIWQVRPEDSLWREVCGVSVVQVREGDPCIYDVMQRSGANPEAIDFLRRYGYFLEEFEEKGKVDYGMGSAWWINMGRPTYQLALNGFPALQEISGLIPDDWNKDPRYADVLKKEPNAFPWPEYGGIDATRSGPDGSTVWTMSFRLSPCRACPDTALIAIDVEWDKYGALGKVTLLPPKPAP